MDGRFGYAVNVYLSFEGTFVARNVILFLLLKFYVI